MHELIVAGGCFWGMEELFRACPGVFQTEVGYIGGDNDNPTYGNHPGHAEALRIQFDQDRTSRAKLLDFFFRIHDPTTAGRQGNDIGASYRSVIFVRSEEEGLEARAAITSNQINWENPVVTTIEPTKKFWTAEEEHQDYLQKHPGGYTCHYIRDFAR